VDTWQRVINNNNNHNNRVGRLCILCGTWTRTWRIVVSTLLCMFMYCAFDVRHSLRVTKTKKRKKDGKKKFRRGALACCDRKARALDDGVLSSLPLCVRRTLRTYTHTHTHTLFASGLTGAHMSRLTNRKIGLFKTVRRRVLRARGKSRKMVFNHLHSTHAHVYEIIRLR